MKALVPASVDEQNRVHNALKHYSLPSTIVSIERNTIGFINATFVIETKDGKCVLRESSSATVPAHIKFEVEVLRYLEKVGFTLTPRLIPNLNSEYQTIVNGKHYMLQNFIEGEVRASWNNIEGFDGVPLENFFKASAEFTKAAREFAPSKTYPNFPIEYYAENASTLYDEVVNRLPESEMKQDYIEGRKEILNFAHSLKKDLDDLEYGKYPKQLAHFDLHPGNMHYVGDEVVGIFDLDWARMDTRFAELGGTISQSCYIYGGERSGIYYKEKIQKGLASYYRALAEGAQDRTEKRLVSAALRGYLFYQVIWHGGWAVDNLEHPDARFIFRHFRNAFIENDFDDLFDI